MKTMKQMFFASAGAASLLAASTAAFAEEMVRAYEVTVTNTMKTELIAPVLVAGTENDSAIFAGDYVTPEAEVQVLTGDPKQLAARIGAGAAVAHGTDGPPKVLLAPGKTLTFTLKTAAPEIRIFAMVAPTEKPDNYLTATIKLGGEVDDRMAADSMGKKAMEKKAMEAKAMETDTMAKDTMAKDTMAKDAMMDHAMIPAGSTLRLGAKGERVTLLRKRLGVDAMGANAMVFDAGVKSAVMDYQSKAGLAADGVVGPMTLKSLNKPAMDDTMAKDTMAEDTMMDSKDSMAKKDTMAADTMAKDAMAKKDTMMESKDAMAKDTMAKDSMEMDHSAMTVTLHRFDIGHDENTKMTKPVAGEFGTVTVKAL